MKPSLRKKSCGFEQNGHATGVVIGPRRSLHGIEMGSQNNQRPARRRDAANYVTKFLPSIRKVIALYGETVAFEFFFNESLDHRQMALAAKGASLPDNQCQRPTQTLRVDPDIHFKMVNMK